MSAAAGSATEDATQEPILPLSDSEPLFPIGESVSVWSRSESMWRKAVVVDTSDSQAHCTVQFATGDRIRQKTVKRSLWGQELKHTRMTRARLHFDASSQLGAVNFKHTLDVAGSECSAATVEHCHVLIERLKKARPYYIGICMVPAERWLLGRSPDRHCDKYDELSVLLRGRSGVCKACEVALIEMHRFDGQCTNAAKGGGGVAEGHAVCYLYVCTGGNGQQLKLARDLRARRVGAANGGCSVLCRTLGGCPACSSRRA